MGLWVRPLPAIQLITVCPVWRSTGRTIVRMNWVRTCSGARQILLLAGRLAICFRMARWRKRLAICAIHGRWLPNTTPDGVCGDKGLRLGGDGGEDAVLVEPHAI
jgi:hypothetical protein